MRRIRQQPVGVPTEDDARELYVRREVESPVVARVEADESAVVLREVALVDPFLAGGHGCPKDTADERSYGECGENEVFHVLLFPFRVVVIRTSDARC